MNTHVITDGTITQTSITVVCLDHLYLSYINYNHWLKHDSQVLLTQKMSTYLHGEFLEKN